MSNDVIEIEVSMKTTLKKKDEQNTTGNNVIIILALIAIVSLIVMIIALCMPKKNAELMPFVPPEFDKNAILGTPEVPDNYGYDVLYQEGMSFKVGLCGIVKIQGSLADIYFTNISDNSLWLKVRIYDEMGDVIGETGIIKPGEYVKAVQLSTAISKDSKIQIKIMSYEPETYHSGGAIVMTPMIKIEK